VDTTVLLIAFTAFLALILAGAVAVDWATERRDLRRTIRGIQDVSSGETIAGPRDQQLALPAFGRIVRPGFAGAARLAKRFSPVEAYERIEQDIVYAGNPVGWDAERIFAFKIVTPFVAGAFAFLLALVTQLPGWVAIAMPTLFAAAGWYAPEWIVRSRAGERQKSIQRMLPDTLDLMSITVQAGLSFDAALTRVARNVKGPLGQELYRVVQEIQLGKGRGQALRDLADRSTVDDLRSFVAAMVQADAFGIPIARVLNVQSNEIRIRRRQRAEEMAQKLPVKIVFPVVLTIFPALFVILLGPAAIEIYNNIIVG
jgi:tight adherence protein C